MDISALNEKELRAVCGSMLFAGLRREELLSALSSPGCTAEDFARGETVYTPESFSKSAGFILSGSLEVTRAGCERGYLMSVLPPGSWFGVAALWSDEAEYVTVLKCARKSRIVFFSEALLRSMMIQNFAVAENYIRFLTGRVRFLNEKIRTLTAGSGEMSLVSFLLRESGNSESVSVGSYSALAAKLNIGRASLYRALDSLEARGLIRRDGRSIEIVDKAALLTFEEEKQ